MATNTICTTCLRALHRHTRPHIRQSAPSRTRTSLPRSRTLITSTRLQHDQKQQQQQQQQQQQPPPPPPPPRQNPPPAPPSFQSLASTLRSSPALRTTTEPYVAYGSTEDLFAACSAQASYTIPSALLTPPGEPPQNGAGEHVGEGTGWWLTAGGLGLEATFSSWAQVQLLHVWMLTVRLRCLPAGPAAAWQRHLVDHFFHAAEERMAVWHGMSARGVRNRHLKDLWMQWRGVQLGYDEGLVRGDAVLAAAVWRNVFKAGEGVDVSDVAVVTAYVRRELRALGRVDDGAVMEGRVQFGDPRGVVEAVGEESPAMRVRLTQEELRAPEKIAREEA